MGDIFRQRNICYLKELSFSNQNKAGGQGGAGIIHSHHTGWKGRVKCFDKHILETEKPTYMRPVCRERTALSLTPLA